MPDVFTYSSEDARILAKVIIDYARTSTDGLQKELAQFPARLKRRIVQSDWLQNWSPTDGFESGRLRSSVKVTPFAQQGDTYSSTAGAYTEYAGLWEFGYSGSQNVKAHTRISTNVFGRKVDPFTQNVKAHTRQVNVKARAYMSSPVDKHITGWAAALAKRLSKLKGGGVE